MGNVEIQIAFMGLCMFVQYTGIPGRTVLIPDFSAGTSSVVTPRGATCVEPHLAYIAAKKASVEHCDGCEEIGENQVLMLGADEVAIEGISDPGYSESSGYQSMIPSMKRTCPNFQLPRPIPPTAARLKIDKGSLSADKMPGTEERYSILTVTPLDGKLTFRAAHGGVTRMMVIKATGQKTNVEIGNRYANSIRQPKVPPLALNHWLAFYSLAAAPVVCDLPNEAPEGPMETTIACSNAAYP